MSFNPIKASTKIKEDYNRYLRTIFNINDKEYNDQLKNQMKNKEQYSNGPFIDVTNSFMKGKSINELISDGKISKEFNKLNFPCDRSLYKHQEEAFELINNQENLVVSTGTGSGKTESFLIPVLNSLLMEKDNKTLNPGVRALIIYPMNALASDQLKRFRKILKDYPDITFGSYTGQTEKTQDEALKKYRKLFEENPIPNELISREKMKETPPNILITNYAMLEYLMIRPDDNVFFEGPYSNSWKYIILDEAHVYSGATGIEVTMLLRRLRAILDKKDLQYILTSATLGDKDQNDEVASFASKLCTSSFSKNNIIRSKVLNDAVCEDSIDINIEVYKKIYEMLNNGDTDSNIISYINNITKKEEATINEAIFSLLLYDKNYTKVKKYLNDTKHILDVMKYMNWDEDEINSFTNVAFRAEKNNVKLFDCKFHMFIKATDSAFITIGPVKKIFLNRKKDYFDKDKKYKVFEIGTCVNCNSIYIVGETKDGYLEQAKEIYDNDKLEYFLLKDSLIEEDESIIVENENVTGTEKFKICPECGKIMDFDSKKHCEHSPNNYVTIFKIKMTINKRKRNTLCKCVACQSRNPKGIIRMFFTGQDACSGVLATSLYSTLPGSRIKEVKKATTSGFGSHTFKDKIIEEKLSKQFLVFSDSRQSAAYFPSYYSLSYYEILTRRAIMHYLNERDEIMFDDLVKKYANTLSSFIKDGSNTINDYRKDIFSQMCLLKELVNNESKTALVKLGLCNITVEANFGDYDNIFTSSEVKMTITLFVKQMLADASIKYTLDMNEAEKAYYHNGVEYGYTCLSEEISEQQKKFTKHFVPNRDKNSKRLNYISKLLESKKISNIDPNELLSAFFEYMEHLKIIVNKENDDRYYVDSSKLVFNKSSQPYICNKCMKVYYENVDNVCPTYLCDGHLEEYNASKELEDNHYNMLYTTGDIENVVIKEHTAQLKHTEAADYQKKFIDKSINILSCSTTFEMGVDVGDLETVFMRNMPPLPSNYTQRSGRAGRSSESTAYSLTFCNKSPHDFTYFANPTAMIKGVINPPKFNINNIKIAKRHIYASAFGFFWKQNNNKEYFSHITNFFDQDDSKGKQLFIDYINSKPIELKNYLNKVFEKTELEHVFGINDFKWANDLLGNDGLLIGAYELYKDELNTLNACLKEQKKNKAFYKVIADIEDRINNYKNDDMIVYLSRNNLIPKYGFPVDTVSLSVYPDKESIELQRDLSVALSEYAPGAQVIANDYIITSEYVCFSPNQKWKTYRYKECDKCDSINTLVFTSKEDTSGLHICKNCGANISNIIPYTFIIPEFGFASTKIEKNTKLVKPKKLYSSQVEYNGREKQITDIIPIKNAIVKAIFSRNDEMIIINKNNFYICEECGFGKLDDDNFSDTIIFKHQKKNGYKCFDSNDILHKYNLGYTYKTDVVQIIFENPDIKNEEEALSVLYALLEGLSISVNIERKDIDGCIQKYFDEDSTNLKYKIVLFDATPGGAGLVKEITNGNNFEIVIKKALELMEDCTCGDKELDTSCYGCLRNYKNQKFHEQLKRKYPINLFKKILGEYVLESEIKTGNNEGNAIENSYNSWEEILSIFGLDFANKYREVLNSKVKIPDYYNYEFIDEENNEIIVPFYYEKENIVIYDDINTEDEINKLKNHGYNCVEINEIGNIEALLEGELVWQ